MSSYTPVLSYNNPPLIQLPADPFDSYMTTNKIMKAIRNRSQSTIQLPQPEYDSFSALHEDNLSKIDMPPSH